MPYTIKKNAKSGYDVLKKESGAKAAHSATRAGAIGYAAHAMDAEKKKKK